MSGTQDHTTFQITGSDLEMDAHAPSRLQLVRAAHGADSAVKPYVQSLTTLDLESCLKLEESTLPESQRSSRETLEYRLTTCGELCLGIFTSADTTTIQGTDSTTSSQPNMAATASTANPVYSGTPARKSILLGHIIATRSDHERITASDKDSSSMTSSSVAGHTLNGRTLCILSFAVLPVFQHKGLGTTLLRSYVQRMEGSGLIDRIAMMCHTSHVEHMKYFGFESKGPTQSGLGEELVDLVFDMSNKSDSD